MHARSSRPPVAIAGTGRVAHALGRLLVLHGWPVAAVAGRDGARAAEVARFIGQGVTVSSLAGLAEHSSRIVIAVADDAIAEVAGQIGRAEVAIHTSGLHDLEPLAVLREAGCSCASMHPLQTIASPERGVGALAEAWFAISGDAAACRFAEGLVESIGAKFFHVDGQRRPLYHAAAVMASNYIVALLDAAAMLMERAGVEGEAARQALGPLVMASVTNTLGMTPERALTGPIRRGDKGTLKLHQEALKEADPAMLRLYQALGRHTIDLAVRAGLPPETAGQLEMTLSEDCHQESHV